MKRAQIGIAAAMILWSAAFGFITQYAAIGPKPDGWQTVALAIVLHAPFLAILSFLAFGLIERFDYFRIAARPPRPGNLPARVPKVCVQLPMFNEDAVAERIIAAACALQWPRDALEVQVLDDSTDEATRVRVRAFCEQIAAETGVDCRWIHRTDRQGYKAGALEAARIMTDARYFAIFDADFIPPPDFLARTIPHFYDITGRSIPDLAVVQAQWGHLNDTESFLTCAQALWVDDHHTLQKTWRSGVIGFVNFTGTAGVWRREAIAAAGGWRAASLVEDCELSIRALFAGYRTRFVGSIVAPAELPNTIAAYRSQQKRWTQGWAQLQRLHMKTLLLRYPTSLARRAYLLYFAGISWQWFLWTMWILILPFLIASGLWLGALGMEYAVAAYVFPPLFFALFAGMIAANEARPTYALQSRNGLGSRLLRMARVVPYMILNTGMMPHHFCAFLEGMLGPLHAEFVRTPKTASTGITSAPGTPKTPRPKAKVKDASYLWFELFFSVTLIAWAAYFIHVNQSFAAFWSLWILACVAGLRAAPALHAAFLAKDSANAR
ncbi:glycosyltransferase family 2 protein [Novosphingobium sp.]|uniref:glycosyltransferase family 2 protein n=1 Tax=Novosphingobium sp. TaxID=1874826 RepID=UPI0026293738|nr:glycosyltransferase family 2 protein [Novosphingobium sp.]